MNIITQTFLNDLNFIYHLCKTYIHRKAQCANYCFLDVPKTAVRFIPAYCFMILIAMMHTLLFSSAPTRTADELPVLCYVCQRNDITSVLAAAPLLLDWRMGCSNLCPDRFWCLRLEVMISWGSRRGILQTDWGWSEHTSPPSLWPTIEVLIGSRRISQ